MNASGFWVDNFGTSTCVPFTDFTTSLLRISENYDKVYRNQALRILFYMLEIPDHANHDPQQKRSYVSCSVHQAQYETFLMRFGPINVAFGKAASSFFSDEGCCLVSWFHGTISRKFAENRIRGLPHGSFLIRFSNQEPDKFSLTHMKETNIRHCLIYNVGVKGFSLTRNGNESYPNITHLIHVHSANRLSKPVRSQISQLYYEELLLEQKLNQMANNDHASDGGASGTGHCIAIYDNPHRLQPCQPSSPFPPQTPLTQNITQNQDNQQHSEHNNNDNNNVHNTVNDTSASNILRLHEQRNQQLEVLEMSLSEKFDNIRVLSLNKETQCMAFDDLISLIHRIKDELDTLHLHGYHGTTTTTTTTTTTQNPSKNKNCFGSLLFRKKRSCAIVLLYLRCLISAADLSTLLVNPTDSSLTSSNSTDTDAKNQGQYETAVGLYLEALSVSEDILRELPIEDFDDEILYGDGQDISQPMTMRLHNTELDKVQPVFAQCLRLAAHVHLKLVFLDHQTMKHLSELVGVLKGTLPASIKETYLLITSSSSSLPSSFSRPSSSSFSLQQANVLLDKGRLLLKQSGNDKKEEALSVFQECLMHIRLCQLWNEDKDKNEREDKCEGGAEREEINVSAKSTDELFNELSVLEIKATANCAQVLFKQGNFGGAILNHRNCLALMESFSHCPDSLLDIKDFKLRILNAVCLACKDASRYSDSVLLCKKQLSQVSKAENIKTLNERLSDLETLQKQHCCVDMTLSE